MHRQTDGQTDRQKQTDYNNPLLLSSVNKQNNASIEHKKPTIPNQIKIICKSNKGSKGFYAILFNQNTKDDTTYYSFWEEALGITIDKDMWKQIFRVCFKTIKDNDLIWM